MKVGVVGMGLIGGSMAKAIHKKTEHTVIGIRNGTAQRKAAGCSR